MKNKLLYLPLVSLLFLGCTKTLTIGNRATVIQPAVVTYYEEVPTYEAQPNYETRTVPNEVSYRAEPVVATQLRPFNITPLEVFDKIQENLNILILDVRMVHEIAQDGKIPNSRMIPIQVLAQNLNRLDKSKEIIVYCHVGNRSVQATKLLRSHGFDAVNMTGGIEAWKRSHLEVKWK